MSRHPTRAPVPTFCAGLLAGAILSLAVAAGAQGFRIAAGGYGVPPGTDATLSCTTAAGAPRMGVRPMVTETPFRMSAGDTNVYIGKTVRCPP